MGIISTGVNLVQNLGGHQGEARRAELRVEASRPVGLRGGGVLGEGDMPPPHHLGIMGSAVISPEGSGAKPRRPSDFCGFWYSGSHSR